MSYLKFIGLFGKSSSRKRTRRTPVSKRFTRPLGFLCLEDRRMLAGILGTAESFAVLGGSTVTNTGPTVINGNLGVSPGSAITGFPPGIVVPPGAIHAADAVALQAQNDVIVAYNDLAGRASNFDLTDLDLGGRTLVPGVYTFSTSAQLTGTLTLDAQGNPDAEFIFQIGSTITTATNSTVAVINGADACNVYWQVGSSATIGTSTEFMGNILALTSITLVTDATILNGRALARNGAVTLDSNQISINGCGSISWEKRATDDNPVLLAGATFEVTPNPLTGLGSLTVVDGGPNDADGVANGVLRVRNALLGTYTITETVAPAGYAIDDVATRLVTVSLGEMDPTVGVQGADDPGDSDESDFHNSLIPVPVGSIAWEKRDAAGVLLGGAQFTITPDPTTGIGILTILDNGPGDADPAVGQILVNNVLLGMYTITETVAPLGYVIDANPTRVVTVTIGDLTQVIGVQGFNDLGITNESDFHNQRRNVIVIGAGKSPNTPQFVTVIDELSGVVLAQFAPYGNTFQGGIRVATGDLTGDGIDEIVTAPGWSIVAEVRVYTQAGDLLTSFQPYGPNFKNGINVAVADVDGDGLNDIITVPSWGPAEVKVFRNVLVGGVPTFDGSNPYLQFLAFPSSFIGGAVVAAADMGQFVGGIFANTLDGKAEIVVGSRAGIPTTVKVFEVSTTATVVESFTPFSTTMKIYTGGVSLSTARITADLIPDIVVGAGVHGGSLVDVWAWSSTPPAMLSSLSANGVGFPAFTGPSQTASIQVAAIDTNGDDIADAILAVQGPGGTTGQIRVFNITSVSPLQVSTSTSIPGTFTGPYHIAAIRQPTLVVPVISLTSVTAVTPDAPAVTLDAPIVTLDAPIVTLDAPIVTPDAPIVTLDAPAVTPDAPAVTPDAPIVTLDAPIVTPTIPAITEAEPNVVTNVWHNYDTPADVNGVGGVTALDALILINYINTNPYLTLPVSPTSPPLYYYDVGGGENGKGDGQVSPLDVLVVINYIKRNAMIAQGESESVTTPSVTSVIEVPIVLAQFDSPEIESPRVSAEPSSGLLDVSSRPIRSMPDTGNVFLHERDLQSSDHNDHSYMESVDLETDILELDSLLTDIALDVASSWKWLA
ncbi:MAG TPA: ice-binding family protein [Pirellulaceae bacterium]|nr:ice-binding family protein [Pirellulaceae bacterium]